MGMVREWASTRRKEGGKPVALSECDVIPDPDAMKEQGYLWSWFSTWAQAAFTDSSMVTRLL